MRLTGIANSIHLLFFFAPVLWDCHSVTIAVILSFTVIIYAYFFSLPGAVNCQSVSYWLWSCYLFFFAEISSLHQCYEIAEILTEIKLTFLLCAGAVRFTDALSGVRALYAASLFKRTLVALQNLIVAITWRAVIIRIGIPCKNIQTVNIRIGIPCIIIQTAIKHIGNQCIIYKLT